MLSLSTLLLLTSLTASGGVPLQLDQPASWADDAEASRKLASVLDSLEPKDSRYKARAGALFLWAGDAEKAAQYFEAAVRLDPNDDDTYLEVLHAYLRADGYDAEVEEWLERTEKIATREKDDGTLVTLAWYQVGQEEWKKADRLFEAAVRIDPEDLDNWIEWGAALMQRGERDAAIEKLTHALSEKPKEERLYWKAGEVLNGHFRSFYGRELE